MIDLDDNRLQLAKMCGATDTINSSTEDAITRIMKETDDGVDVAIEAVGIPASFDICQNIIRPGGHIAVVGVHGHSLDFQLQKLWIQNITLTTGLVSTNTTPMLLKTITSGKLNPEKLISHRFLLMEIIKAYEVFGNAEKSKSMKIILQA
jgi:alcohol dehydrogenase